MTIPIIKSPCCGAALTPTEIRSLVAKLTSSLRTTRSGGKVWREHRPDYSRCRCAQCNARRKLNDQQGA